MVLLSIMTQAAEPSSVSVSQAFWQFSNSWVNRSLTSSSCWFPSTVIWRLIEAVNRRIITTLENVRGTKATRRQPRKYPGFKRESPVPLHSTRPLPGQNAVPPGQYVLLFPGSSSRSISINGSLPMGDSPGSGGHRSSRNGGLNQTPESSGYPCSP